MVRLYSSLVVGILSLALHHAGAFASANAQEQLRLSASYFDKGQYHKAITHLEHVDIRADFDNSDDMKLAFKIRAISYEQTGESARACETIRELFFLDPNYQFNPFDTPQSVVALAQKEKAAIDEKTLHLASLKNDSRHDVTAERPKAADTNRNNDRVVVLEKKPTMVTTLFPLGINHFYLRSPVKGGIYLSLQTLAITTNVAAFWWKQSYLASFGGSRLRDEVYKGSFETAQTIQYVGLGALLISYGISVIDALIRIYSIPTQKVSLDEITS